MAEKNCFDRPKLIFQIKCVTVVQWSRSCLHVQINRVQLPATLFSVSLYRFYFVFLLSLCFSFSPVFLYSYCWPRWSCTWINIYFKLKSRVLFWERNFIFSWSAYLPSLGPEKPQAVNLCPLSSQRAEFFSMLVDIMTNNTQYTTNCTNLHPTPTSDPLAKVKLAFCTSS